MTAEVSAPARAVRSRREGADELLDFVLCAQLDRKHGQPAELNTEFVGPLMNQVFDRELNGMTGELIDQLAEHVTGLKDDQGEYIFPAVGMAVYATKAKRVTNEIPGDVTHPLGERPSGSTATSRRRSCTPSRKETRRASS